MTSTLATLIFGAICFAAGMYVSARMMVNALDRVFA